MAVIKNITLPFRIGVQDRGANFKMKSVPCVIKTNVVFGLHNCDVVNILQGRVVYCIRVFLDDFVSLM